MRILPGDMSRPGVEAVAELREAELAKFTNDVSDISISSTATIKSEPIEGKIGWLLVTIRVDKSIDGDLLKASLKDGMLHEWGWGDKFKLKA
jgi:hypothetical protein